MSAHPVFIIIGLQSWDTAIGSNCKNIAETLSQSFEVHYLNAPLDVNSLIKQPTSKQVTTRLRGIIQRGSSVKIRKNLTVHNAPFLNLPLNRCKDQVSFEKQANKNAKRLGRWIEKIASGGNYYLFNDNDFFKGFDLRKYTHPEKLIYYCRDYLMGVEFWKKHGKYAEPNTLKSADVCFTNSFYLQQYCKQWNTNTHFIGQGCETDAYNPNFNYPRPSELPNETKIVGYTGYLTSLRLDIPLLEFLAKNLPNNTLLALVGPEDEDFGKSRLHEMKNVIFTGGKKPEELPAFVKHFDVCINPQAVNEITIGNYPRKIDEYLAMGKPVVATHTETMEYFAQHCSLAKSKEEFLQMILNHLQNPMSTEQQENNRNFALSHTWQHSVNLMLQHLQLK